MAKRIPTELMTLVPEPWALRAADRIWREQAKLLAELGHPSRGEPYYTKTVTAIARMIQYCHDAALPRERN